MAEYTSNSEFDLAKRVQITNEVPSVSLWHHLPSGLKTEFWEYLIGKIDVETDVPLLGENDRPLKTVNGSVASEYGPVLPATIDHGNPTTFHSMDVSGVIMPEFDFFLHELYRYLDSFYPDHPDYDKLLTPLELNDAFRAAAALIGYVPDYKFLEAWSASITGNTMTREQLKWKIRDLRTLAFRRKFFGSYQGYKLIFSSIYRHGSVYLTGTYRPRKYGTLDYEDARTFKKFRLIDYLGDNDTVYKENARTIFNGIVDPSNLSRVYEYKHFDIFDASSSSIPDIALGTFLYKDDEENSLTTVQTIGKDVTPQAGSLEYHYANLSAKAYPSQRDYIVEKSNGDESIITLVPNPMYNGSFSLPLSTALEVYAEDIGRVTDIIDVEWSPKVEQSDTLIDNYVEEIISFTDKSQINGIERGCVHITMDPERSPVMENFPVKTNPQYGLEFEVKTYDENDMGVIIATTKKVFLQGTLEFSIDTTGRPYDANFTLSNIPDENPLCGVCDNRANLLDYDNQPTISIGATISFAQSTENEEDGSLTWSYMPGLTGWLDSVEWGRITTLETMSKNIEKSAIEFSDTTFRQWKLRAAGEFKTGVVSPDELNIYGSVLEGAPTQVTVTNETEGTKLDYLSAGDIVRGPGIQPGTVIASVTPDYFVLSLPALRFGTSEFTVALRSGRTTQDTGLLQFKNDLYSKYPTTDTSIFSSLWPSTNWPYTAQGYIEGLKDASLFRLPPNLSEVTDTPSPILFDKSIFIEMSIDRVLYHANSAGFTLGGVNASLMDLPWLEFVDSFVRNSKRATEDVYVGAQLSLSTDTSGLYSIIPEHDYTDPSIKSKFITIPYNYELNSVPAYVQLGTGGHTEDREKLFVSVSDLLRPPLYGAITFDSNRDVSLDAENVEVKRRGVYTSSASQRGAGQASDENISSNEYLDSPLFEVPIGEYEYLSNYSSEDLPSNRFQVVQTSFYAEDFEDIPLNTDLVVNSPYIMKGEQLPRDLWTFKGRWNPSPNPNDPNTPIWPKSPTEEADYDENMTYYYLVSTTTYIGTYEYSQGDWLIYDDGSWRRRQWLALGEWPPADEDAQDVYLSPSKVQLQSHLSPLGLTIREALDEYIVYFIASADLTLLGLTEDDGEGNQVTQTIEVKKHDWVILTRETYVDDQVNNLSVTPGDDEDGDGTPDEYILTTSDGALVSYTEYQPWLVAGGKTYEIIRQSFDKSILSNSSFNTIATQRAELIDHTLQTRDLPRRFISRGSCNFQLKIDPQFKATDIDGVRYNLTESEIEWDSIANRFFVYNEDDEGTKIKHYIKFQEPSFFKNLNPIVGTVHSHDPYTVYAYDDLDFDADILSLTDQVKSGMQVYVRNQFEEDRENEFYTHYVDIVGEIDEDDRTIIRPVVNSPMIDTRREDFRIALQGINNDADGELDSIKAAIPTAIRSYEDRFENKYFKNLLLLAAKISKEDPSILLPVGETDDDIRAMSEAARYLQPGDYVNALYVSSGVIYKAAPSIFTDDNKNVRTISFGANIWLAAGTGAGIAIASDPNGDWTEKTISSNFTASDVVSASYYSLHSSAWWLAGSNGNMSVSTDDCENWNEFISPADWSATEIKNIVGSNPADEANGENILLMVGSGGKVAYYDEDDAAPLWTTLSLPADEESTELTDPDNPGTAPIEEGWGMFDVNDAAYGQSSWIIVGNESRIARATDLTIPTDDDPETDTPASVFSMVQAPAEWGDGNPITSIHCENDFWVICGNTTGSSPIGMFAWSDDGGFSWTMGETPEGNIKSVYRVTYKAGEWIAVGAEGNVYGSADGKVWASKELPGVPSIDLYAAVAGNDTLAFGGNAPDVYTISSKSQTSDALAISAINQEGGMLNIELDFDAIPTEDFGAGETEKTILLSFYTLASIDNEMIGIPVDKVSTFTDPTTGQFYLSPVLRIDTYEIANRVYMPRSNEYLISEKLTNGDPNPDYIGANGFPLYEEAPDVYYLDDEGEPVDFTNEADENVYYADENGNYINSSLITIYTKDFTQIVESEDDGSYSEFIEPRYSAFLPQFTLYEEWLEAGYDIEENVDTIDFVDVQVESVYNEQDEEPYLKLTTAVPELAEPFNAITLAVLPVEPVPVPLVGVPHYRTDGSGNNQGIVAAIDGEDVYYSVEPFENEAVLLATKGGNEGIVAGETSEGDATYSLEPVKYVPSAFVIEEGSVTATTRDGKTYYTVEDDTLTGVYFPADGYGSWADRPNGDTKLPWENDPNAFYRVLDGEGLPTDEFFYLQNKRQDAIHLVDEMGRLIKDENGDSIEVPAMKYFTYAELLADDGDIIEKDPFDMPDETKIIGVGQEGTNFTLSSPVPMEEGATTRQIRLNILTLASIETTEDTKNDPRLIYPLTVTDMARYEPDRVYYLESAYPSEEDNAELYEAGLFTNRNGVPVYGCNDKGEYVQDMLSYKSIDGDLALRTRPPQPKFYLCQEWFDDEYFVTGDFDNPYWQYIIFEDYLDLRSKEWKQRVQTYKKRKGDFGKEMVFRAIDDDEAYVTFYPGLEYTRDAASMIVRQTEYINYKEGKLSSIIVSNPKYDKTLEGNEDIDAKNAQFGINYDSIFHESTDLEGNPINMFDGDNVVQSTVKGKWNLNYTVNTTKNFANPADTRSSVVAITELGVFNSDRKMIGYANFPAVIYDSARHHFSVNLFVKQGEFAPT